MTFKPAETVRNLLRGILASLDVTIIVRYERKLIVGITLALTAFVPALGVATFSLHTTGAAEKEAALLYRQQVILSQTLKGLVDAEDTLMPLFVLTGDSGVLEQKHQKEHDLDTVLAQLLSLEPPASYGRELLSNIALAAHRRDGLSRPGIAMRLNGASIQTVNQYFRQNTGAPTDELHAGVAAFMKLISSRLEMWAEQQHRKLHWIGIMFLTADGFAVLVSIGVSAIILRLLQVKRHHDATLVRQAEWEHALARARKEVVEVVAHDLQNSLQGMTFAAEKIQAVTTDGQSVQSAMETLSRSVNAMRRLIDTVLNPASIAGDRLPVFKRRFNLAYLYRDSSDVR